MEGFKRRTMKTKTGVILLSAISLSLLIATLGCNQEGSSDDVFAANAGGSTNIVTGTNALASFVGSTINQNITSSTGTNMASSGTFTTQFTGTAGAPSGDFRTFEPNPLPGTSGTFVSSITSPTTSTVVFNDTTLGIAMTEQFTFNSSTSGTFVRNLGPTQSQSGTFTVQ